MSERCQLKDLTGQRFGKLTVISRNKDNSKSGNARWNCLCDCGNTAIVIGSKLRNGYTKSCGCARKSDIAQGYAGTRLYRIWRGMFRRCYKKNSDNYKYYGGRGITICKEWREFIAFRNWALSNGYADNLTIDRIDPNKQYSPNNCRWATKKEQQNNKTNNSRLEYRGKSFTYSQFADYLQVPYWTIINQLKLGWTIEKIVNKAKERNAR